MGLTSLVAQMVKNLPATWETQIQSLGQEDPLEEELAIHASILAWRIPLTEESGWLLSMGSQRVGRDWVTNTFTLLCMEYMCYKNALISYVQTAMLRVYLERMELEVLSQLEEYKNNPSDRR